MFTRVKSLSKGNTSKKDPLLSTLNIRESVTLPSSSSALSAVSTIENNFNDPNEHNRFGWSKQLERDTVPHSMDRVSSGREDDFEFSEELYDSDKPSWKNSKHDTFRMPPSEGKTKKADAQTKWKDFQEVDNSSSADDDLNALLQVRIHNMKIMGFLCTSLNLNSTCKLLDL